MAAPPPHSPACGVRVRSTSSAVALQAVLAQKGAIKEQVDLLRRLMGDVQLMGGLEDTQAEAQPG